MAVVGHEFVEEYEAAKIVGAVVGPIAKTPNVYANSANNVEAAIRNRLIDKAKPYTGTKEDLANIGMLVRESMYQIAMG